ncbi:sigma-54-dependent Fis family transcriptional regulator [bacterium]|nr:sigma-54-dependent Fis family transcriptional regulator [bacterium]
MFVGQSPQSTKVKRLIREIAKTDDHVLFVGEVGTGKKHAAMEIHERSKQKNRPFVVLNCTAAGDAISEADILGEISEGKMGVERKIGLLEQAHKGILYLENVQDLSEEYQLKLFNIIKEGRFQKPGDNKFTEVSLRVFSASTDKSLDKKGGFRKDLLALISTFVVNIPKLSDRRQDIPFLFTHFLEESCREFNHELPAVPAELFESMMEYDWRGNVHELKNAIRNLVLMSPEGTLSVEYLPFEVKHHPFETLVGKELPDAISEVEGYLIKRALARFAGNQTKAAHALNVSEAALRYKMKKYHLTRKAF